MLNRFVVVALVCAALAAAELSAQSPIVFVHGNGDHAGLWDTTIWRFESNGYPDSLLFAVDLPHPAASSSFRVGELNRSTPEDQTAALAGFVSRVLLRTGAQSVVLVGSSRGGMTIRNYLRFGGGSAHVSHAILGGSPNHGVFALAQLQPENEFNGAGSYLRALNDGEEVVDGVRFLTIRSDGNDKYAQADGAALGMPGVDTNVDARGPALRGAQDVVLEGADHREVAFSNRAFAAMYEFITGRDAARTTISDDSVSVIEGLVSGTVNGAPTNLALIGAAVSVYRVDPKSGARIGAAQHRHATDHTGRWGPFRANPEHHYEFEIAAPDSGVMMHVFRAPFPRSSRFVNFRLPNVPAIRADSTSVTLVRPRGYLGRGRDTVQVDGVAASDIPPGVATIDRIVRWVPAGTARSLTLRLNGETIVVQTRASDPRRLIVGEFNHE